MNSASTTRVRPDPRRIAARFERLDPLSYRLWLAGSLAAAVAVGFGVAGYPFLTAGAVGGAAVLLLLLLRPMVLLGLMLGFGAVNLAILTGGEKELFDSLGGLDMNGIRLVGLVAGFTALVVLDRRMLAGVLAPTGRWYLVFLLFAGGTLLYSPAPVSGLRLLFKLAYPFLIFVAVMALVRGPGDLARLGDWTLMAAAFLVLVVNPILVLAGGYTVDASGHVRVQGLGMHQNPFSYYLLAMALLSLSRYVFRNQLRYLVLALCLTAWIILTLSRMTLAASLAALAMMAVYGAYLRRNLRPVLGAAIIGAAIAIPLTPVVLERTLGYVPQPGELLTLLSEPAHLAGVMRWGGRDLLWPVLLEAGRSSPILGLGIGASGDVLGSSFSLQVTDVPHNEYLRLWVDTGVVGVLLFFVAVAVWAVAAARAGRWGGQVSREYALPAVAAIVAWALISITGNPLDYYTQFTQYVAFFAAAAVAGVSPESGAGGDGGVAEPAGRPDRIPA